MNDDTRRVLDKQPEEDAVFEFIRTVAVLYISMIQNAYINS